MQRVLLLDRVARDERVERRAARLRPEHAAEALRLLLARAHRAGELDEDVRVGQVDREVADAREHELLRDAAWNAA